MNVSVNDHDLTHNRGRQLIVIVFPTMLLRASWVDMCNLRYPVLSPVVFDCRNSSDESSKKQFSYVHT